MVVCWIGFDGICDVLLESLGEVFVQGQEDVGFGLEVVIEGIFGDFCGSDDVVDGGGVYIFVQEQLLCCCYQFFEMNFCRFGVWLVGRLFGVVIGYGVWVWWLGWLQCKRVWRGR